MGSEMCIRDSLKAVCKMALPMAKQALIAGLAADSSIKNRLKAASQSALTKKNILSLAKAESRAVIARPFWRADVPSVLAIRRINNTTLLTYRRCKL